MTDDEAVGTTLDPGPLLLTDLERFENAMARNEEMGEKRFASFFTIVTAVVGGLVLLATNDTGIAGALVPSAGVRPDSARAGVIDVPTYFAIARVAIGTLFVIGLLTYLRMLQRARTTDEYKKTLTLIRSTYVTLCPPLRAHGYRVPVRLGGKRLLGRWFRGGYAETMGVILGMLCTLLIKLGGASLTAAVAGGIALTVLLWLPSGFRR